MFPSGELFDNFPPDCAWWMLRFFIKQIALGDSCTETVRNVRRVLEALSGGVGISGIPPTWDVLYRHGMTVSYPMKQVNHNLNLIGQFGGKPAAVRTG